ncbi:DNA-protecting protein DprA [Aestuariicella hydrocarbonica]|uniref:DNA-protecting protein DprA n=1 Tax=Pseudomaricurvus hydrocarbonicus TaxID=1470433 RepID=A0A9E5MPA8_9GAMM|nr:DNA-processing protein DprA [Aestuariicella hydrocarbonica]NHO67941.1 DNA-protecting protein DprA [Aestuariicella hydrocarbonica]
MGKGETGCRDGVDTGIDRNVDRNGESDAEPGIGTEGGVEPLSPWSSSSGDDPCWLIPFLLSLPGFGVARYWQLRQQSLPLGRLLTQPLDSLLPFFPAPSHSPLRDFYRHRTDSQSWRLFAERHQALAERGVTILTHEDLRYPELLAVISQAPPVLYLRGSVEALNMPQIAFVGSRHGTLNGKDTARHFARYLASVGLGVTSGLAQGIDACAHQGALAGGGATIAVMGTGIDRVYPARHRGMADDIVAAGGVLVTEFPPGTPAHSGNFPRRNRIISGLSLGVVVVEAALKSGSLITARCALEQNREVFAIPGSIHNPLSRGCHHLIRDGATLVETAEDIARELRGWASNTVTRDFRHAPLPLPLPAGGEPAAEERLAGLTRAEAALLKALGFDVCDFDELLARLSWATPELLATLMQLELRGLISQEGGNVVRLG